MTAVDVDVDVDGCIDVVVGGVVNVAVAIDKAKNCSVGNAVGFDRLRPGLQVVWWCRRRDAKAQKPAWKLQLEADSHSGVWCEIPMRRFSCTPKIY